jgi:hypothetical protein
LSQEIITDKELPPIAPEPVFGMNGRSELVKNVFKIRIRKNIPNFVTFFESWT